MAHNRAMTYTLKNAFQYSPRLQRGDDYLELTRFFLGIRDTLRGKTNSHKLI